MLTVPRKLEPDSPRDLAGYQGDFEDPALNGSFPETDAVVRRGAAGVLHWVPRGVLQIGLLAAEMPAACCCFLRENFHPLSLSRPNLFACTLAAGLLWADQLALTQGLTVACQTPLGIEVALENHVLLRVLLLFSARSRGIGLLCKVS